MLTLSFAAARADETLFREYAVVNLKHYKSGAVRRLPSPFSPTPPQPDPLPSPLPLPPLLAAPPCKRSPSGGAPSPKSSPAPATSPAAPSAARSTPPSPAVLASLSLSDDVPPDPADERPLVEARLEELEVPFRYVEAGEAKSVLVKVVLCRECARKLRHGRRKAKEDRDKRAEVDPGACVRLLVLTDVGGD